jgi:ATP-dependent helicase/nuclease subunit B
VTNDAARRPTLLAIAAERTGRLVLTGPAGPFTLTARADRIDRLRGGGLAIVDYKTGTLPSDADVQLGYAPQLALEAAMAVEGGFAGVAAAEVAELAFWQLTGREPAGKIHAVASDPTAIGERVAEALDGLRRLIAKFDDPATAYLSVPRPEKAPRYSDYAHLARIKEWSVAGEGEE